MKREFGISKCGLACCLCSENTKCLGCNSDKSPDKSWCINMKCAAERKVSHCYECKEDCKKDIFGKLKPYAFTLFAKRYGEEELLNCLERNDKNGIVYHSEGINGDYDNFTDAEALIEFIRTGKK